MRTFWGAAGLGLFFRVQGKGSGFRALAAFSSSMYGLRCFHNSRMGTLYLICFMNISGLIAHFLHGRTRLDRRKRCRAGAQKKLVCVLVFMGEGSGSQSPHRFLFINLWGSITSSLTNGDVLGRTSSCSIFARQRLCGVPMLTARACLFQKDLDQTSKVLEGDFGPDSIYLALYDKVPIPPSQLLRLLECWRRGVRSGVMGRLEAQ